MGKQPVIVLFFLLTDHRLFLFFVVAERDWKKRTTTV